MEFCASCGHELGDARFCTSCGRPAFDDWRTGTAERPAVATPTGRPAEPSQPPRPPAPPPPPYQPVSAARFPLFADEVTPTQAIPTQAPTRAPTAVVPAPTPVPGPTPHRSAHRRRGRWVPVAVLALLTACTLGFWQLASGDDPAGPGPTASGPASSAPAGSASSGTGPGEPDDVARLATARVPATAPPNQDLSGNMVRYEARNMLDGVAETCWRMPGDASGAEITVALAEPTTLTSVGMINGYAKVATDPSGRRLDWYHGNRRVLAAEWVFDDGTTVSQSLVDTTELQTLDIDPVTTSTVRLRLVSVSAPGGGRSARNNTAISDLALVGRPS